VDTALHSIYCDGASSGRPNKPGGYGWVIVCGDEVAVWGYGGSPSTTNNLMEIQAAIEGLKAFLDLFPNQPLELVSDSEYMLGLASGRYYPSKNKAEAKELILLTRKAKAACRWVKGHNKDKWNEVADKLAGLGKREWKWTF
jgi:ribonuclease HI